MKRQTRALLLNTATGIAIAATAALVFLPTIASAAPATASTFVNVRQNPTPGSRVVNTLERNEAVDVQECRGSWCYVVADGPDGWVAAQYLKSSQPNLSFGITGPNGNTIQFGVNVPNTNPPPPNRPNPRPPVPPVAENDGEACFFARSNFRGDDFCVQAGDRIPNLDDWSGEISSIDNPDELDVTVCTRTNFRGDCRTYTTSSRSLGRFDDTIASVRVD